MLNSHWLDAKEEFGVWGTLDESTGGRRDRMKEEKGKDIENREETHRIRCDVTNDEH